MENILHIPLLPEEPLENKINKMVDALCRQKDKVLMEVVFHTAFTLTLSLSPIAQLFRNICFLPHVVKVSQDVWIQILPFMITLSGVGSLFLHNQLCQLAGRFGLGQFPAFWVVANSIWSLLVLLLPTGQSTETKPRLSITICTESGGHSLLEMPISL